MSAPLQAWPFGTEPGTVNFDDSTAVLTGTWGPNQTAQGTVRTVGSDTTQFEEVEIRLNSSITSNSITGYEINCSVKSDDPYTQIVRWNGPLGNFTLLDARGTGCRNGDVLKAINRNGTITSYINGTAILSVTDHAFTGGSPGWASTSRTAAVPRTRILDSVPSRPPTDQPLWPRRPAFLLPCTKRISTDSKPSVTCFLSATAMA